MQVMQAQQTTNGIPPQNYYYAVDDTGRTAAQGYLIPNYQPYLFPERPLSLFINIDDAGIKSPGPARDLLMGALLARCQQEREAMPTVSARLFAMVNPADEAKLAFYAENGFDMNDAIDVVQVGMPAAHQGQPMGYIPETVPLDSLDVQLGFLSRMNSYRLDTMQLATLQRYMRYSHFLALCLTSGGTIAGEIFFTGEGQTSKLLGLYVHPNHRRKGLGKWLVATGMGMLANRGVTYVEADVVRRSEIQRRFAASCNAALLRTGCLLPGLNYD